MNVIHSPGARFAVGVMGFLLPMPTMAQYRVVVEPSVEVSGIHDDNLFYSDDERPASDYIQRIRPALELRLDSPRLTASGSYAIDSDRFATHSALNNDRARQNARLDVRYRSTPRVTFAMNGAFTDTDTPAELNAGTGLGFSRVRAQLLNVRPSATFQISPRLVARATSNWTRTNVTDGTSMRASVNTIGFDRRFTARDHVTLDVEQGRYRFDGASDTNTLALLGGWTRDIGRHTRVSLSAGPRFTDGDPAAELGASLTRTFRRTSFAISGQQTHATVVGYDGVVQTRILQGRVSYSPTTRLTMFAAPAVYRSASDLLDFAVHRIAVGARYTIRPAAAFDVSYIRDAQRGTIGHFSHSTLSIGLITHWKNAP